MPSTQRHTTAEDDTKVEPAEGEADATTANATASDVPSTPGDRLKG